MGELVVTRNKQNVQESAPRGEEPRSLAELLEEVMEASRTENNSLYLLFNNNTRSSELINLLNIIHNQATVDLGQMSLLPSRQQLVLFIRRRALDQSVAVRRSALQVPRSTTDSAWEHKSSL